MAAMAAAVLVLGGGAVAVGVGSAPDAHRVVGCYDKVTGDLRIVKRARQCHGDEKVLRWNKRGPRGLTGAPGVDGATILTGSGAPGDQTGSDGDYYVDTGSAQLFGPKAAGAWPEHGVSLRGATGPRGPSGSPGAPGADGTDGTDGNTVLNGTTPPGSADGTDGDFYLDTATFLLYGPKTSGAWGAGTSIRGPQGIQGDKGDPGDKGDKGDKGDPGSGNVYSSSSGTTPGTVTTLIGGLAGSALLLPLSGSTSESASPLGGTVDLTSTGGGLAQVIPEDTTITSMAARLSTTTAMSLVGESLTVTARLYTSPSSSNVFTEVPGASCTMAPSLTGLVPIGTVSTCTSTGLAIPLTAGTNAIFLVTAESTGIGLSTVVTGHFSTSMTTG